MISSEHKYRVLTENAPIGIYYNDLNGTFLYGNRKAEEVTGYERDALIGKNFLKLKLLGPKSIMKAAKLLALNKLGKSTGPDYFTLNRKDGTQRQVEICTEIINIDEKRVVLGMVQDITERNQTEEALRESERKFREMTDLLPQIVYETDLLGNFTFVNKHGYMTFGYSENDLKTGFNMLQTLIPEDRDRAKENIQSIMSGKPSKNTEYTVVKKDGSTFPVLVYSNPVLKNHKPVGMRGIIIDITERKRAEEALIASKSRLMAIFDNSPVAIYEADAEGKCLFVNKKWCEFAGLTPEEARGDGWQRALHPDDREHIFKVWSQHAHSNKSWNFEYRFNTPTNVITHVWGTASALRNEHGEITGYIGVNIDITERRQAEQALRESEERFRIFVEHAADSFYLLDLNGRLVDVNSAACTSLGYTREELLSLSVPDIDVDFPADKLADFLGNLTEGEAVTVEGKQKRKDGSTFPVELRVGRLGTEMQPMILALARDITERRQAEEALHKSEEKYRKIFENVRDVYYQTGYDGTITEISPSIERHSGYTREALIGTQIVDFYFYPKDYLELCEKLEQNGEVNDFEIRLKDKQGRLNYGSVNARIVFDVDGKPVATEGTLRDITDRRQAEKEKANLERQLHLAKKMETIGTLAGGIAHDFNNILQPILGYTEMALSSLPATDPLSDDLQQILDGANRAKDLVNQILTFSRQHEQERKPLQLQLIIQEALKLMRPSIPTTIEIRKRIDSSCEKVSADATQIHQVIVNLCTNAFQVMEEKGGVLTIELKQVEVNALTAKLYSNLQQKEYALLTIRDTGIGMDQATLERVFEPFFTTKMVDGGTGLGLSVVHGIIRSHQGEIIVKSELGKGSTFQVYLPILTDRRQSGEKDVESIPVGQESILVVDDEEAIIGVMKRMLGRLGYRVIAKNSSIEGLKAFRQRPAEYDLVITDLTMPNLTGLELAKEIGKIRSGIPVILMTGYGENIKGDLQKGYGIQAIVGKPIMFRELAAMVRKVIDKFS